VIVRDWVCRLAITGKPAVYFKINSSLRPCLLDYRPIRHKKAAHTLIHADSAGYGQVLQAHRDAAPRHMLLGLLHRVFTIVKNAGSQHGVSAACLYAIGQMVQIANTA
jgi:hypothetical protein